MLTKAKEAVLRQHWLMPTLVAVVSALGLNQAQWAFRNANAESLPGAISCRSGPPRA